MNDVQLFCDRTIGREQMLKRAKTVLSDRQYRKLCIAVNEAADYNEKKGLIKACIQGRNKV